MRPTAERCSKCKYSFAYFTQFLGYSLCHTLEAGLMEHLTLYFKAMLVVS